MKGERGAEARRIYSRGAGRGRGYGGCFPLRAPLEPTQAGGRLRVGGRGLALAGGASQQPKLREADNQSGLGVRRFCACLASDENGRLVFSRMD